MWFHKCSYEGVSQTELTDERVLEVTLWDFQRGGSNEFIGGLRFGSHQRAAPGGVSREYNDSSPGESAHWKEMLAQPEKWVEKWHALRSTMDPREPESTTHHRVKPAAQASPLIRHSRRTSSGSAEMVPGHAHYSPPTGHSRKASGGSHDVASGSVSSSPPSGASETTGLRGAVVPRRSPLSGHLRKGSSGTSDWTSPVEVAEKPSEVQESVLAPASEQEDVPEIEKVGVASNHQSHSHEHLPKDAHLSMKDDEFSNENAKGSILSDETAAAAPETAISPANGRCDSREEGQTASGFNLEGDLEGAAESFNEEFPVVEEILKGGSDHNVELTDPPPADMPSGLKVSTTLMSMYVSYCAIPVKWLPLTAHRKPALFLWWLSRRQSPIPPWKTPPSIPLLAQRQ